MNKKIIMFLLLLSLLSSCTQTGNFLKLLFGQDYIPPDDYKPVFISKVAKIKTTELDSTQMVISRINPNKDNKARLYVHLIENGNTFLSGAAEGENKKIWCQVIDSVNGKEYIIKDFKIRESTKADRKTQAIAMVMDHSGSMGDYLAKAVQAAVTNFINYSKKKDDEIALIKYDNVVGIECSLTKDLNELKRKFKTDGLGNYGGGTATLDAIYAGIKEVSKAKSGLDRVIMVFTDGQDNNSHKTADQVIAIARKYNVTICSIDYGFDITNSFLENISKSTNGTYNHIFKANEFDLVFRDIYLRLEKYYEVEFQPVVAGHHKVVLKLCPPKNNSIFASKEFDNLAFASIKTNSIIDSNESIDSIEFSQFNIEEGEENLLNVNFDNNSDILKNDSYSEIEKVYSLMLKNPTMTIELRGHTDSMGTSESNLKLSQDRADAVKIALIKKGIDGSRIKTVGYGDTMPIDNNDTEEGRAKNRRTEFLIITK